VPPKTIAEVLTAARDALRPSPTEVIAAALAHTLDGVWGLPEDWSRIVYFYIEAFEDVPEDLLHLALKRQRLSASPFFPKPGELRGQIIVEFEARRLVRIKLDHALTIARRQPPELLPEDLAPVPTVLRIARAAIDALPPMPRRDDDLDDLPPLTPAERRAVADQLATYRLIDADDPRVLRKLAEMGEHIQGTTT
jgi:hypothetical protein